MYELDEMQRIVERYLRMRDGRSFRNLADLQDWMEEDLERLPDLLNDAKNEVDKLENGVRWIKGRRMGA